MSPVRTVGLDHFTGRKAVVEEAIRSFTQGGALLIDDTQGIRGIGKTTLLAKLYNDIIEKGEYRALWLDIGKIGLNEVQEDGDLVSVNEDNHPIQDLLYSVYTYRRLLFAAARELNAEEGQLFANFEQNIDQLFGMATKELLARTVNVDVENITLKGGDVHIGMLSRVVQGQLRSGDVNLNMSVPDEALRPNEGAVQVAMVGLMEAITAEFVDCLNAYTRFRRLIILMDNYQLITNQLLSEWIRASLLPNLRNLVIVLVRIPSDRQVYDADEAIIPLRLVNFSRAEVEEYVRKRLGLLPPPEGLVDRVYQFSGGHPQVISLAVDLAVDHGLAATDLLTIYADLPRSREDQLSELVNRIVADIEDEDVRRALEIGWIARRFDGDLLRFLMSDPAVLVEGETQARYIDIITLLERYSFTEYHPGKDDEAEHWKFHDFIRQQMERSRLKNSRDAVQQLHRRLSEYYAEKLKECEEQQRSEVTGATEYQCWYNYENPRWQSLKGEWLYHLARMESRKAARLAFARVFFDAFWWWGCYRPFPFCDELLKDWRETQITKPDQDWYKLLIEFQQDYPTGYAKYGLGNWENVEEILLFLREDLGLNVDLNRLSEEGRHTRAMLDLFLAHSYRYRDLHDLEANRYYEEALDIFEKLDDNWNQGWTLYEYGDLAMERGQVREALDRTSHALRLANLESVQDQELMANCYRTRADISWGEWSLDDAFANYSAAMFYAYAFQGYHAPDFYTVDFLREMQERTRARLSELVQMGQNEAAISACEYMERFWMPYWRIIGPRPAGPGFAECIERGWLDAVSERLFPPLPTDEELGNAASKYVRRIIRLYDKMREAVEERRMTEDNSR